MRFFLLVLVLVCCEGALVVQIKREYWQNVSSAIQSLDIIHSIGNHTYLVRESRNNDRRRRLGEFTDVLPKRRLKFKYRHGIHKLIISSSVPADVVMADVTKELPIDHFKVVKSLDEGGEYLFLLRVDGEGAFFNETIHRLVHHPHVLWVDYYHKAKPHNLHSQNLMIGIPPGDFIYSGEGELITIGDTGVDQSHCAFRSPTLPLRFTYNVHNREEITRHLKEVKAPDAKIRAYLSVEFDDFDGKVTKTDFKDKPRGHGTHVAGTALGSFSNCKRDIGYKSSASLLMIDFENSESEDEEEGLAVPPSLRPLLLLAYDAGSRIMSHSWGMPVCEYTHYSMEIDNFVYFHDDMIVLFAAGNSGPDSSTIGAPSTFKNGIAVGASQNDYTSSISTRIEDWNGAYFQKDGPGIGFSPSNLADFSSRGPTCDGRIKPDIVAPGEFILSSRSNDSASEFLYMRGTSMATPGLARLVALIREILSKRFNLPNPSAALVKNILISSAAHLGGHSSHMHRLLDGSLYAALESSKTLGYYDEGYGLANLRPLLTEELKFYDRLPIEGYRQPQRFRYRVRYAGMVTVGLVWTDPPGYLHNEKILVNDLNIYARVINNNQTRRLIYGNHFELPDELNNIEKIQFAGLVDDEIEVIVSTNGPIVFLPPLTTQRYSLVVSNNLEDLPSLDRCFLDDPPFQCIHPFYQGERPCTSGRYDASLCLPSCTPGVKGCVCTRDVPCGLYGKLGDPHFSKCSNGNLTECKEQVRWKASKRMKEPGLTQLLRILSSDSKVNAGVWATFFVILLWMMLLVLVFSSTLWWIRRSKRKTAGPLLP